MTELELKDDVALWDREYLENAYIAAKLEADRLGQDYNDLKQAHDKLAASSIHSAFSQLAMAVEAPPLDPDPVAAAEELYHRVNRLEHDLQMLAAAVSKWQAHSDASIR